MVYEVDNAKAIAGAAFIHYVIYMGFYAIDAIKFTESEENTSDDPKPEPGGNLRRAPRNPEGDPPPGRGGAPAPSGAPVDPGVPGGANPGVGKTVGNPVDPTKASGLDGGEGVADMRDVNIEMKDENENRRAPPGTQIIGNRRGAREVEQKPDDDEKEEDLDGYDDEGKPFFTQIVNRMPKSIIFYWMVIGFCAARASTPFVVAMAYLSLIGRGVQIVGAFTQNEKISYIGFAASIIIFVIMYFAAMAHEAD